MLVVKDGMKALTHGMDALLNSMMSIAARNRTRTIIEVGGRGSGDTGADCEASA